jgi:hypothetical protein
MSEEQKQEKVKEVNGFQCQFCGQIYPDKPMAEKCWDSHVMFEMEPLFTIDQEFPIEVLVKKLEGDVYTEIATYAFQKTEKVSIKKVETIQNE